MDSLVRMDVEARMATACPAASTTVPGQEEALRLEVCKTTSSLAVGKLHGVVLEGEERARTQAR
jgi:hypothetical protein